MMLRFALAVVLMAGLTGCGPTAAERYATAQQIYQGEVAELKRLQEDRAGLIQDRQTIIDTYLQKANEAGVSQDEVWKGIKAVEPEYEKTLKDHDDAIAAQREVVKQARQRMNDLKP